MIKKKLWMIKKCFKFITRTYYNARLEGAMQHTGGINRMLTTENKKILTRKI